MKLNTPSRSDVHERVSPATATKRQDLVVAITRVLVGHLVAQRDGLMTEIEGGCWAWNCELSRALETVDEALTRLGYFDVDGHHGDQ